MDPTFDRSDVVQLLGTRHRLDQSSMMSNRSDICVAHGNLDLLGLPDGKFLSNAYIDSRELLLSAWDSHYETKIVNWTYENTV